ncbi:hypothetical protein [Psychrobacillus vulpis]|nr:hypothetical protein [Psychrobacillus vulpis]
MTRNIVEGLILYPVHLWKRTVYSMLASHILVLGKNYEDARISQ